MKFQGNYILFILFFILFIQNSSVAQDSYIRPTNEDLIYQVFCVGNTGAGSKEVIEPTLQLLQHKLGVGGKNSAVIFLGDLLPKNGMPDSGDVDRREAEQRLKQLTDAVVNFEGRIFFVPGEHDWGIKKKKGWKSLLRMENFIEKTLDRGDVFVPSNGFPGPEHIKLTDKIRLIALNTQWLLTENKKRTGDYGDYDIKEDDDFYVALEDMIMKRATKAGYQRFNHCGPSSIAFQWALWRTLSSKNPSVSSDVVLGKCLFAFTIYRDNGPDFSSKYW
jgi:hypothetical protein